MGNFGRGESWLIILEGEESRRVILDEGKSAGIVEFRCNQIINLQLILIHNNQT